jgi:hypothetical protein
MLVSCGRLSAQIQSSQSEPPAVGFSELGGPTDQESSQMKNCMPRGLIAASCSLLLASCSATRSSAPTRAELAYLVLVIRESPDGQVSHSWERAEDFELSRIRHQSSLEGTAGRIVLASGRQDDCYAQYIECYHLCRKTPVPPEFNQYLHDFGVEAGHDRYCSEKCMREYTRCLKGQGHRQREFTAVDSAVDWLKRNHKAVLIGSVVVIAGVVFVAVSAGAGLVVLAPAVLVTSGSPQIDPPLAVVFP